jgi:SNF2 family DNA or RNA helicase
MYKDLSNPKIQQMAGYIKNNIKFDNLDLYSNVTDIYFDKSDIYKIYNLTYIETHKIDNDDVIFKININIIRIIHPELFTPQLILDNSNIRDILHQHYISMNNLIDNYSHNYRMEMFMQEIKTQLYYFQKQYDEQYNVIYDDKYLENIQTRLFTYQINCIKWMKSMELDILDNTIDITNDKIIKLDNGIHYNFIKNSFLTHEDILKMKHYIRGGIIANEVGTGKTVIAIGHIINNMKENTLILVPSHLKQHWIDEFKKHTILDMSRLNVSLFTFDELKKFSIDELKNMTEYTRIIIDEIHEIYNKKLLDDISNIPNIKYRWGITGTPIVDSCSLYNILTFLIGKSTRQFYNKFIGHQIDFQKKFTKFFQRSMKSDLLGYKGLPNLKINNILLNFSEFEQELYNLESYDKTNIEFLRKLCCDILLSIDNNNSQGVTIKELKKQLLDFLTKNYNKDCDELNLLSKQIDNIKINIANLSEEIPQLQFNLSHYQQLYDEQEKICNQRKTIIMRYSEILNKIEDIMNVDNVDNEEKDKIEEDDVCSICLSAYTSPIAYLIPCGHYFCKMCFSASYNMSNHNCPMCRVHIEKKDILTVSKDITNYVSTKYKEVTKLITQYPDNFVIYTQFSHILQNLKIHLERFNINCGYLEDFMSGNKPQVLLMSSESTSSGLDLTYYSNVIIFEPFINYMYSREKEKQIIGRLHRINQTKPVNVFRLIIKNTIEEEIYNSI